MLFSFVVLIASSQLSETTVTCPGDHSAILQEMQLSSFLEPSEENRRILTPKAIERLLLPMRTEKAALDPASRECLKATMLRLGAIADEEMLSQAVAEQAEFYKAMWKKHAAADGDLSPAAGASLAALVALGGASDRARPLAHLPKALRVRKIGEGRANCAPRARGNRCTLDLLTSLAIDDPAGDYFPKGAAHPVKQWVDSTRKLGDRRARIALLLDDILPTDATALALRGWAVDELLGSSDPRSWNPADVALVLRDLEVQPRNEEWRSTVFKKVLPMGVQRVIEIVDASGLPDPSVLRFSQAHTLEHFPGEFDLYTREWLARENKVSRQAPREWGNSYEYVSFRWKETDDAAPHPDLIAVQTALQKLRGTKTKK